MQNVLQPRRMAEAQHQHSGGQWIERAAMADLHVVVPSDLATNVLHSINDFRRRTAGGLMDVQESVQCRHKKEI